MNKELEKLALIQKVFEKLAEWNAYDLARLDEDFETNFDLDFLEIEKELTLFETLKPFIINNKTRILNHFEDTDEYDLIDGWFDAEVLL